MKFNKPLQLITLIGSMFIFINCQQPTGSDSDLSDDTPRILSSLNRASQDKFGYSVSISGDYAIIGAYNADPDGITNSGAAYIFHRNSSNNWVEESLLTASDKSTDDNFGISVSISGNYAIVGAAAGEAAYIFYRDNTTGWDSGTKVEASDGVTGDKFGESVSINGDYAVVGSAGSESVYVFKNTGSNTWNSETKIFASDGNTNDYFGGSVSISGDYIIVGAYSKSPDGVNDAGSAYIFNRTGSNTWDGGTIIVASDKNISDTFGRSVSISGNYAVVGADGAEAAYVFNLIDSLNNGWDTGVKLIASDGATGDDFGLSVSISGENILVGADHNDVETFSNSGAAYIYGRTGTNSWDSGTKLVAPASARADEDYYGRSVSISSGYSIIGTPNADVDGKTNAGRAFIESF